MSCKNELRIENYLEYFGDAKEVANKLERCLCCGAKLLLSHLPDYRALNIQETSRCLDCGEVHKKVLHVIN
jgi:uncharacterized protein with PIN domain